MGLRLSQEGSPGSVPSNKGEQRYDSTRKVWCWQDENAAVWEFGEQRCRLAADLSANTTVTLQDVTGLGFSVRANTNYEFEFDLLYSTVITTTGIKLGITGPASPVTLSASVVIYGMTAGDGLSNAAYTGTLIAYSGTDFVVSPGVEVNNAIYPARIHGKFLNGVNAGVLQLQWASEVGTSGVTPRAGSSGRLWIP